MPTKKVEEMLEVLRPFLNDRDCWNILCALRGPDYPMTDSRGITFLAKYITTSVIRRKVNGGNICRQAMCLSEGVAKEMWEDSDRSVKHGNMKWLDNHPHFVLHTLWALKALGMHKHEKWLREHVVNVMDFA